MANRRITSAPNTDSTVATSAYDLTADDIFNGGEEPFVACDLVGMKKGGGTGRVYLRHLSAGEVLRFTALPDNAPEEEKRTALLQLICKAVVDREGNLLFSGREHELERMPITVFNQLSAAVTGMAALAGKPGSAGAGGGSTTGGEEGKGSGVIPN